MVGKIRVGDVQYLLPEQAFNDIVATIKHNSVSGSNVSGEDGQAEPEEERPPTAHQGLITSED